VQPCRPAVNRLSNAGRACVRLRRRGRYGEPDIGTIVRQALHGLISQDPAA
jgi:hypothetical protein